MKWGPTPTGGAIAANTTDSKFKEALIAKFSSLEQFKRSSMKFLFFQEYYQNMSSPHEKAND